MQSSELPADPHDRTTTARLIDYFYQPVDVGVLVYFRIAFGLVMLWETFRYQFSDKVVELFIRPNFFFDYYGFSWIDPWPGEGMRIHYAVMSVLAVMIAVGLCYRLAAFLFFLAFTFMFLTCQSFYLNHFYLISIVSGLMVVLPAHYQFSLDAWLRPRLRQATVPFWTLWLLRFQIAVPYVFGGIAKLNADWLAGEPMRHWLTERYNRPIPEPVVYGFAWGGMLFDLLVVPALLWAPTRAGALMAVAAFHLINDTVFTIGIFPWMMLAASVIFLPSEWFRISPKFVSACGLQPLSGPALTPPAGESSSRWRAKVMVGLLGFWVAIQVLVPFRHFLYPGNPSWTEEGHRFAWHMKLRSKDPHIFTVTVTTESGNTYAWYLAQEIVPGTRYYRDRLAFRAENSSGMRLKLDDPAAGDLVERQISDAATRPDMTLQLAQHLAERVRELGEAPQGVYVTSKVRLNYRDAQDLIDPNYNLLHVERDLKHADWILPLKPAPMHPPR